jgi:flagellar basal body-associated protein FliL
MSEQNQTTEAGAAAPAAKGGIVPWIVVGVVASGIGAAVPFGMSMLSGSTSSHAAEGEHGTSAPESASHGGGHGSGHGASATATTPGSSPMVFIQYGEVTVNLDEQRMNRYLRIKIVLHVRRTDESIVKTAISEKELLLRSWLVSHLSDKELDEIRGKAGQNMLRREIRDQFNATLFPDHYERIYDVLFQEFNVQ